MAGYPAFADGPGCLFRPEHGTGNPSHRARRCVGAGGNGGLGFNMWATLVANDGTVCAVAFSGTEFTDQWLASRVISAQKANTANGLSLGQASHCQATSLFPNGLALSTANLYSAVQPGGSLYGLQHSNPSGRRHCLSRGSRAFGTGKRSSGRHPCRWYQRLRRRLMLMSTGGKKSAASALAAIPPAPTTWSPGSCATASASTISGRKAGGGGRRRRRCRHAPTTSSSTSLRPAMGDC